MPAHLLNSYLNAPLDRLPEVGYARPVVGRRCRCRREAAEGRSRRGAPTAGRREGLGLWRCIAKRTERWLRWRRIMCLCAMCLLCTRRSGRVSCSGSTRKSIVNAQHLPEVHQDFAMDVHRHKLFIVHGSRVTGSVRESDTIFNVLREEDSRGGQGLGALVVRDHRASVPPNRVVSARARMGQLQEVSDDCEQGLVAVVALPLKLRILDGENVRLQLSSLSSPRKIRICGGQRNVKALRARFALVNHGLATPLTLSRRARRARTRARRLSLLAGELEPTVLGLRDGAWPCSIFRCHLRFGPLCAPLRPAVVALLFHVLLERVPWHVPAIRMLMVGTVEVVKGLRTTFSYLKLDRDRHVLRAA
mmetsp:Transcript_20776/g.61450  ORF Transcript_20776/g.61450 Transcript_20776/m.61450 type:complete len:362 (+) Transcript_20776:419-1504(+)